MRCESTARGLTLLETLIGLLLIIVLLAVLLPALSSARVSSYRDQCSSNLRTIGQGWSQYLADNDKYFPYIHVQPGWRYAGVRFSTTDGSVFPDVDRPLTSYLPLHRTSRFDEACVCCPADRGIRNPNLTAIEANRRTMFQTHGNSYRMNSLLLTGGSPDLGQSLHRNAITTSPSRLLVAGDPVWHEMLEQTGNKADWHGVEGTGNILLLDGHVRFIRLRPKPEVGPVVADPFLPRAVFREQ